MDANTITWIWFGSGVTLAVLELVFPGLVTVFMGAAAIVVALLRWAGLVESLGLSFGIWMVTSVVLVLGLRRFVLRWSPSESRHDMSDEFSETFGRVVEVVEPCHEHDTSGRIRFQGTTWSARSAHGTIAAGQKARLLHRENVVWLVEPAGLPDELAGKGG